MKLFEPKIIIFFCFPLCNSVEVFIFESYMHIWAGVCKVKWIKQFCYIKYILVVKLERGFWFLCFLLRDLLIWILYKHFMFVYFLFNFIFLSHILMWILQHFQYWGLSNEYLFLFTHFIFLSIDKGSVSDAYCVTCVRTII